MKKNIAVLVIVIYILIVLQPITRAFDNEITDNTISVGYSKICINPNPEDGPIPLAGYGNTYNRVARFEEGEQRYQQDLYATAVALKDDDGSNVIFVTCDLIAMGEDLCDRIRQRIEKDTNIEAERIMISCTHTHSAPDTGFSNSKYPELTNSVTKYRELLENKISIVCSEALNNIKPSDTYIKTIDIVREDGKNALNFVRHYETDNTYEDGSKVYRGDNHGSVYWQGDILRWAPYRNNATKADSSMQLIKFERENEEDIVMVNWQTHPHITGASNMNTISADLIASFRNKVEQELECKVAYYTGAAGNINWNSIIDNGTQGIQGLSYSYDKSNSEKAYETSINFGNKLAEYVINNYSNFESVSTNKINIEQRQKELFYEIEKNENLYNNAKYCELIWNSSLADVAKMIDGSYNWSNNYIFPNGIDRTGEMLRKVVNQSDRLKTVFAINGNDEIGYTCTLSADATQSDKNYLISYLGAKFNDRIYSPFHAKKVVRCYNRKEELSKTIELNTILIGDISFVTVPDEIFDTNGTYVKNNSPSKMTFVLELTNGSYGYIPSEYAYEYGCYEADTTNFVKGSGEAVADELLDMLSEEPLQLETKYSIKDMTKEDVIVTITANKELQEKENWTLSEDKKTLTKKYEQNIEEQIMIKDILGNRENVTIKISNIDKIGPKLELITILSDDKSTETAIISANEEVQKIDGWNISNDNKTLSKTYTGNITEEITVKDLLNNETKYTVAITNIEKIFDSDIYEIKDNKIKNINPNTTLEKLKQNITSNQKYVIFEGEKIITDSDKIKTGQVLEVEEHRYKIVVSGDTNGDGEANIHDIMAINKHRLKKHQLENEYCDAADVNKDNKVDIQDILKINKYRLNIINILNN